MKKRNPVMKFLGGKRGIAVLLGSAAGILAAFGVIPPKVAEMVGGAAAVLGGIGIVHSNIKEP